MDTLFPINTPAPTVKKRGCKYHGRNGKFTDKTTAEIVSTEKRAQINERNAAYWKTQAERLSQEVKAEQKRVKELTEKLKIYEQTHLQQKAVFITQ